jgi:hypothetical protein
MASTTYDKMNNYFPKTKTKEDFIGYINTHTKNYKLEYLNKTKAEYNSEKIFSKIISNFI